MGMLFVYEVESVAEMDPDNEMGKWLLLLLIERERQPLPNRSEEDPTSFNSVTYYPEQIASE